MNAPIDKLLSRLDAVRERGGGKWMACCPSHDDGRPSLSIEETGDGTVLIHCFAQCSPTDVLTAVGLQLRDLFPGRTADTQGRHSRSRPTFSARDVIELIDHESSVVMIAVADIVAGRSLTTGDLERIMVARQRISRVREVVG